MQQRGAGLTAWDALAPFLRGWLSRLAAASPKLISVLESDFGMRPAGVRCTRMRRDLSGMLARTEYKLRASDKAAASSGIASKAQAKWQRISGRKQLRHHWQATAFAGSASGTLDWWLGDIDTRWLKTTPGGGYHTLSACCTPAMVSVSTLPLLGSLDRLCTDGPLFSAGTNRYNRSIEPSKPYMAGKGP